MAQNVSTVLLGSDEPLDISNPNHFSKFVPVVSQKDASNVKYILNLFRIIPKLVFEKDCIIHAQRPDILFPFFIMQKTINSICTLHGAHDLAIFDKKGKVYGIIYSIIQKWVFQRVSILIAVDKHTGQYYSSRYPFIKNKLKVIPIGIDFEKFKPSFTNEFRKENNLSQEDKIVLFVGRLESEKNIGFLIDAYRIVKENCKQSKLIIVGKGREEAILKEKVNNLGLNDVLFLGEVAYDSIPKIMGSADVFAFCSHYEGSPTVIKEALASDLPIVSVHVGDVTEVIEPIEGCYLAKRDISDFAEKILTVLSANRKLDIRSHAEQYDVKRLNDRIMDIYKALIRKNA
ncbi:MAG: glycosyltransferase family 4 protein [Bacteroidales bacterium]|nr:glycosyltransferase family 4 protein [Bacteroidales bacterium]